jgi:hypothetical protein
MASDHAGVVARLAIATGVGIDRPPGPENSLPWGLIIRGGAFALAVSIALVVVGIRKLRRDPIR